jgi:oxygen-independent coproporphyrinogen-3 oxidase
MYETDAAARYVRALIREIAAWNEVDSPQSIDTIYFGGGTPSLLDLIQIESVLTAVRERFEVLDDAEITLEINPGDGAISNASKQARFNRDATPGRRNARAEFFRSLRSLGINRASFGAQTFDDRELKMLGRAHDAADIGRTFALLRDAGFGNINFDLIAGLPHQTLAGWKRNLRRALQLRPEHLSLYLLDVHKGTPLHDQIERGLRPKPDEDLAAEMYALMVGEVCAAGYGHYEISNFCLAGFASRHNTKYWTREPYYGFGNSAHSHDGARRRWANVRDAIKYVEMIEDGNSPIVERNELSEDDIRSEAIFLGMRLMSGLNLQEYRQQFGNGLCEQYNDEIDRLKDAGLIEIDSVVLKLTSRGALLSNEVFGVLA